MMEGLASFVRSVMLCPTIYLLVSSFLLTTVNAWSGVPFINQYLQFQGSDSGVSSMTAMAGPIEYTLPKLPYAYDALEPHISAQIMTLHHSKHHQTYVTNLNKALAAEASFTSATDIPARIANQQAIKFNGGGHINHSLFWANLAPAGSAEASPSAAPSLGRAIDAEFGGLDAFKSKFNAALLAIQGSGWGWLVKDVETGRLAVVATKDQDPVPASVVPVFGVDMWEHAYYLQYLNSKPDYVKNVWSIINWKEAELRYNGGRADAFKVLQAKI